MRGVVSRASRSRMHVRLGQRESEIDQSCIVLMRITDLFLRPTYDTSVVFSAKAKVERYSGTFLTSNSLGGILRLFFLIVPTNVSPFRRSFCPSPWEANKLSAVTLCPFNPSTKSRTTRSPWFFSGCPPTALPRYG